MARSKSLTVVISGDASQLTRAVTKADKDLDRLGKSSQASGKRFSAGMKLAGAAAAGALTVGLKQSATAAIEAEKTQARLQAQLKASGLGYREHARAIEASISATSRLSGLDDEDLTDSFTNIVRVTGDVNQALKLNGLAADFARAKNIDVAKAGEIVGKVAGGNVGVLGRYGIQIEKGATSTEALGKLQEKFAGQAEAYGKTTAGATDRAKVGYENLQEVVGKRLAPGLAKVANRMADLAAAAEKNPAAFKAVAVAVGGVVTVLGAVMVAAKVAVAFKALRTAVIAVNIAMRANPVIAVATALGLLAAGLVIAYKRSETFRRIVDETFRVLKSAAGNAIAFVLRSFDKYLGGISTVLSAMGKLPGPLGKPFRAMAKTVDSGREKVRGLADDLDGLGKKKVRVSIQLKYQELIDNGAPQLRKTPFPSGDGVGRTVRRMATAYGRKNPPAISMGNVPGAPSGSLMGANSALSPFASVGAAFGLRVSSGRDGRVGKLTSSGNTSFHSSGEAVDLAGSPSGMMQTFRALKSRYGPRLAELIYSPAGGAQVKNGRNYLYGEPVRSGHFDHVHVALDLGSPGPGIGGAAGYSQGKQTGDGPGRGQLEIARQIVSVGRSLKASPKVMLAAIEAALVESNLANLNYGDRDSVGVFQQRPSQGWKGLMNVSRAAREFITRAMASNGRGSAGQLAQRVQGSAFPGRYDQRRGEALDILRMVGGSPASRGRGSGGASRVTARATRRVTPLERVSAYDEGMASASVTNAIAARTTGTQDDEFAAVNERGIISRRIVQVRAGLRKKGLRPATKQRLTQELGQLLENHNSVSGRLKELRTPVAVEPGESGGGGDQGDPNQALIDAIAAKAEQDRAIADEQARQAEDARRVQEELTSMIEGFRGEAKRQNDLAASQAGVQNSTLVKALADILSGQIVGVGLQGRGQTAGMGSTVRY